MFILPRANKCMWKWECRLLQPVFDETLLSGNLHQKMAETSITCTSMQRFQDNQVSSFYVEFERAEKDRAEHKFFFPVKRATKMVKKIYLGKYSTPFFILFTH